MTHHNTPIDHLKMALVLVPTAQTTGALTSSEVDMQGFNGCMFLVAVGAETDVFNMKIMSSAASGGTLTAITGAAITQFTGGQGSHMAAVSIYRPTNRYLKAVVTAASAAVNGVIAAQFDPVGLTPVIQPATTFSESVEVVEN